MSIEYRDIPQNVWNYLDDMVAGKPDPCPYISKPRFMAKSMGLLDENRKLTEHGFAALLWHREMMKQRSADKPDEIETPEAPLRLTVDFPCKTVTLDGEAYDCNSELALRWVKVLADHPGEWISATELSNYDPELLEVRPDRLRRHVPKPIFALIETNKSKGSRISLT